MRVSYKASRVLAELKTAYQQVVILENETFGRVLMLDGAVQTTTHDEFIYHEMLAHVPLFTHGSARDVLIIGGGDCGLAEEVLKHRTLQTVTQVEIDPDVVELSRKYLSQINAPVFSDTRFELQYADGAAYVKDTQQSFDVVLVDSTDPVGAARTLFTSEFYLTVRQRLRPGGVLVCPSRCSISAGERVRIGHAASRDGFSLRGQLPCLVSELFWRTSRIQLGE
jgi:spermidine synthase